jgi:hypothetical protein
MTGVTKLYLLGGLLLAGAGTSVSPDVLKGAMSECCRTCSNFC